MTLAHSVHPSSSAAYPAVDNVVDEVDTAIGLGSLDPAEELLNHAPPRPPAILPSNVTPPQATPWRVTQNPWLIGALVFATYGLYRYWWLWQTWSQIKYEQNDETKRPVWHALAVSVPIYGWFRFYAHMRAIANLAEPPSFFHTRGAVVAVIVLDVLRLAAIGTIVFLSGRSISLHLDPPRLLIIGAQMFLLLSVLERILFGALYVYAQDALNTTWRSLPGTLVEGSMHWFQWLILATTGIILLTHLLPV